MKDWGGAVFAFAISLLANFGTGFYFRYLDRKEWEEVVKTVKKSAEDFLAQLDAEERDKIGSKLDLELADLPGKARAHLSRSFDFQDMAVHGLVSLLPLVIFILAYDRWAMGQGLRLMIIAGAIAASAGLLGLYYRRFQRAWYPWLPIAAAVIGLMIYAGDSMVFDQIQFRCPLSVSSNETITGRTPPALKDAYIYPVVWANIGKGWVQEVVHPDADNNWSSDCVFATNGSLDLRFYASEINLGIYRGNEIPSDFFVGKDVTQSRECPIALK